MNEITKARQGSKWDALKKEASQKVAEAIGHLGNAKRLLSRWSPAKPQI
jgi:hypothetical protein